MSSSPSHGGDSRTNPRRILLVEITEDGTVGGSHQCLYDLVRGLDRTSYTPIVLFYRHNPYVDRLRAMGVQVHAWDDERRTEKPARGRPAFERRLRARWAVGGAIWRRLRLLRHDMIDLIHLNNSPCVGFSDWLLAARLRGVPCVAHARAAYLRPHTGLGRWLTRHYDRVIAISRHIAEDMRAAGIPAARITQVYDGIELARWNCGGRGDAQSLRESLGIPASVVVVVMVGHLRSWKGQDVVLEALRRLDPQVRALLRVLFVGDAPASDVGYQRALIHKTREAALEACVTFLGQRDDVPELMRVADVVLHASTIPEPLGLVVLEAMALGKAVVASKLGGPGEVITQSSGILFDPTHPEHLAAHLVELAGSPSRRAALGEAARERARAFDVRYTVEGVQRVYSELLEGPV